MKNFEILEKLIENEDLVVNSYSGKPGCMCGCNGKYSYSEKHRNYSSKHRGYKVEDEDISNIAVKRMINKFKKLLSDDNNEIIVGENFSYLFYSTPTRYNAIYFKEK